MHSHDLHLIETRRIRARWRNAFGLLLVTLAAAFSLGVMTGASLAEYLR